MTNESEVQTTEKICLPCGCIYVDKKWLVLRIHECELHKKKRTTKRPFRPKAECVRP